MQSTRISIANVTHAVIVFDSSIMLQKHDIVCKRWDRTNAKVHKELFDVFWVPVIAELAKACTRTSAHLNLAREYSHVSAQVLPLRGGGNGTSPTEIESWLLNSMPSTLQKCA